MIPIECPRCGRGGNVPPDRLNARLHCKACQAIFHMDTGGRMVLGEPGGADLKGKKGQKAPARAAVAAAGPSFDLGETLRELPKPVKFGVPAALVVALAYTFMGSGESTPAYNTAAETIVRKLMANDKSGTVALASADSADAAGRWFDLLRKQIDKAQVPADPMITPTLLGGDPQGSELTAMVVLPGATVKAPPLPVNLLLKRDGSSWKLDGTKSLAEAEAYQTVMEAEARKPKKKT